eukprot:scaffold12139_cov60-Cyclotella_meneghiniana.AAC.1
MQVFVFRSTQAIPTTTEVTPSQIKYAIMPLQSLLIYEMQIWIKGSTEQQQKLVRHLNTNSKRQCQ